MDLTADKDGKVSVTWPQPGMYWLNANLGGGREGGPGGPGAGQGGEGAPPPAQRPAGPPQRRASYVTTLEVLAP